MHSINKDKSGHENRKQRENESHASVPAYWY